jgi:hypothetical protein
VPDGRRHDDRVNDIGRARRATCDSGCPASTLIVRDDVTSFEDTGNLLLRSTTPSLRKDYDWHHRPDPGRGQLVMERKEIWITAFCGD